MPLKLVLKCNREPGTGTEYLLQPKMDGAASYRTDTHRATRHIKCRILCQEM